MSSLKEDQIMSGPEGEENDENDEDKQEDLKDFTKHKFECKLTLDDSQIPEKSVVTVCNPGAPTALMKINHSATWKEIGKVETKYHEKSQTSLTVYVDGSNVFILIDSSLESLFCGSIISQLWPSLSAKNCSYLCLSSIYKNNYSTFEGFMSIDADYPMPIRYFKSSNGGQLIDAMLKHKAFPDHILPSNQLNSIGGLSAAIIMYAEMYGQAAAGLVVIDTEH